MCGSYHYGHNTRQLGNHTYPFHFALYWQELQAFENPTLITLVDGPRGDNQICIGYKNQFDLINEKNGDTLQLHQVDAHKVSPYLVICPSHNVTPYLVI